MPSHLDTSDRPFVLVWEPTQACDLACKHCRADAQPTRHPDELSTAEAKDLLDDIRQFVEGQLVVLSGGDPLKRDDAEELVEYGTDIGLRITMTPSGTESLTADRIDALAAAGLRRMALSIDGSTAGRHDGFRQEEGCFEATIAAAKSVRQAGLPLQINTTVCAETVDDLPEIRPLVRELGAVLWAVFFLVPVGRGAALEPVPAPKAEQVLEWLYEVSQEVPFDVKTTEAPHYRRVVAQQRHQATPGSGDDREAERPETGRHPRDIGRRTGIIAGDGFAFVSHVGEVFPSGFLPKPAGTVREASIVNIYQNSELFRTLRDRSQLKGKCGACEFRHVCGGSRSRAFAYTGDPLESDPLCAYRPPRYDGPSPEQRRRFWSPSNHSTQGYSI